MAENQKPKAEEAEQEQKDNATTTPSELVIRRHGKDLKIPYDRALKLVEQGLELDSVREKLEEERRSLAGDSQGYAEYQRLQALLQANPQMYEAVKLAMRDPNRVLNPPKSRDIDDDDDASIDTPKVASKPTMDPQAAVLKQKVTELEARLAQRDAKDAERDLMREVDEQLGDYSWLTGKQQAAARRSALNAIVNSSGRMTPTEAVATAASEIKELLEDKLTSKVKTHERRQELGTVPPDLGIPGLTPETKFTEADLKSGKVLSMATKALNSLSKRALGD